MLWDDSTCLVAAQIESYTYYSVYTFVLINQRGDILWSRVDSVDAYSYGVTTDKDHDGNIVSLAHWWLANFTGDGELIDYYGLNSYGWDFTIGYAYDMKTVKFPSYGTVIAGLSYIPRFDGNIGFMIYLDAEYDSVWSMYYGATGPITCDNDALYGVEVVSDPVRGYPRGFIGVGNIHDTSDTTNHGYIVRTDMEGNIIWEQEFGSSEDDSLCYEFYDIVWIGREEHQTRFAVVGKKYANRGSTGSRAVMFFISDTLDGDSLWTKTYEVGTEETVYDNIRKVVTCSDGGFLLGGLYDESADLSLSTWLCRVDSLGNDVPYSIYEPRNHPLPTTLSITAHPNPFNSQCNIDIPQGFTAGIYDIRGNLVHEMPEGTSLWNAEGHPSGIYIIRATKGEEAVEGKVVLVR